MGNRGELMKKGEKGGDFLAGWLKSMKRGPIGAQKGGDDMERRAVSTPACAWTGLSPTGPEGRTGWRGRVAARVRGQRPRFLQRGGRGGDGGPHPPPNREGALPRAVALSGEGLLRAHPPAVGRAGGGDLCRRPPGAADRAAAGGRGTSGSAAGRSWPAGWRRRTASTATASRCCRACWGRGFPSLAGWGSSARCGWCRPNGTTGSSTWCTRGGERRLFYRG